MGKLKTIKLGEQLELQYGKALKKDNRIVGDFIVYGSNGPVGTHNEAIFKGPGIIIGRKGTVGAINYSEDDFYAIDTTYVVELKDKNDSIKFWYYYLKTIQLDKMNSHSAVPGLNREAVYKKDVAILDDLSERKAIAATLSCLDDKIELNNQINKTLEEMAQAIFKSWFVDFEPFQDGEFVDSELGIIPKGWRVGCLLDIADYLNGLAMQKFKPEKDEIGLPVLKIKDLRQGSCDESSQLCSFNIKPEYIVHNGDVIFSWSGSLLVDFWCGGECGLNQHLFKVTSKVYDKWFYYSWTLYHLDKFISVAADKATTMGHIKRDELSKADVLIPSKDDYVRIGTVLKPIYDMLITNRLENRKLANMRDMLLPKLMSGEIYVSDLKL